MLAVFWLQQSFVRHATKKEFRSRQRGRKGSYAWLCFDWSKPRKMLWTDPASRLKAQGCMRLYADGALGPRVEVYIHPWQTLPVYTVQLMEVC